MEKNTIITLEDNKKYMLLEEITKNKNKYYFAIKLDKENNPTINYELFELIKSDNEKYMNIVEGEQKEILLLDFINKYISKKED